MPERGIQIVCLCIDLHKLSRFARISFARLCTGIYKSDFFCVLDVSYPGKHTKINKSSTFSSCLKSDGDVSTSVQF